MRHVRAALIRLLSLWLLLPMALRVLAPLAVMMVLWYWSSQEPSPQAPSLVRALMHNGAHVVAYCGLGGAWLLALLPADGADFAKVTRRVVAIALGLSISYGIADELHQSFVPGRHSSFWDVVCDACGSVLAIVLVLWTLSGERRFMTRLLVLLPISCASIAAATWLPG